MGEISRGTDIHRVMREAVEEGSKRLPSYQRISDYAISREPLEFTGFRRHVLEERYERARRGVDSQDRTSVGPVASEEMSGKSEHCSTIPPPRASGISWPSAIPTRGLHLRRACSST